ncbi:2-methoxy-6-polyprenyl-1,4-benzoquinol methylase, mitochondrial [Sporomusa aerivorans]
MLHQHPGELALTRRLIELCSFVPGAKVLDVGCGTGATMRYIHSVCRLETIGIDSSAERLNEARMCSPGLTFIQASGESLPFAPAMFDGVLAECSLSVMQDVGLALQEISRVLVPGGKMAITDLYLADSDSSAGYLNKKQQQTILRELGFTSLVWEDQSAFLREFVARYIMEHGSMEELWQCVVTSGKKIGYFLLVAEKKATKG